MTIRVELDGAVAVLTIDNPERGNALSPAMMVEFAHVLGGLEPQGAGAVVLRGAEGSAFCAGYDLGALADLLGGRGADADQEGDADQGGGPSLTWEERLPELTAMLRSVEACPLPVIAAVNGHAIGGGALLASLADLRVGQSGARFQVPASRLGVLYPLEGVRRLVALLGLGRATWLLTTGDPVDSDLAAQWGLYEEVTGSREVVPRAVALARRLTQRAPLSVRGLRALLRGVAAQTPEPELRALHREWTSRCLGSRDLEEGLAAARERRAPAFEGR